MFRQLTLLHFCFSNFCHSGVFNFISSQILVKYKVTFVITVNLFACDRMCCLSPRVSFVTDNVSSWFDVCGCVTARYVDQESMNFWVSLVFLALSPGLHVRLSVCPSLLLILFRPDVTLSGWLDVKSKSELIISVSICLSLSSSSCWGEPVWLTGR